MSPSPKGKAVWTIVVAAGSGTRFGGKKQLETIGNQTVLEHSVGHAREVSDAVVVVIPTDAVAGFNLGDCLLVTGGASRSESVRRGLDCVPENVDYVLVHDAARPLASSQLFRAVIGALERGEKAVVPLIPVVDSLKRLNPGNGVTSISRDNVFVAQTPQGFACDVLRSALTDGSVTTDDVGAVERIGVLIASVPGETSNLKITSRADLDVARILYLTQLDSQTQGKDS